jgi:hypothetical protein
MWVKDYIKTPMPCSWFWVEGYYRCVWLAMFFQYIAISTLMMPIQTQLTRDFLAQLCGCEFEDQMTCFRN